MLEKLTFYECMYFLRGSTTMNNTSKSQVNIGKHHITLVKQVTKILGPMCEGRRSAVCCKKVYFT